MIELRRREAVVAGAAAGLAPALCAAAPQTIAPKGKRHTGQVRVLVGPKNSSATVGFARAIRRERSGMLVGEATGGDRRGIKAGFFYFVRLPKGGLKTDLLLVGLLPRTPEPDAGIVPDVTVTQTADALATGADPTMARARAT